MRKFLFLIPILFFSFPLFSQTNIKGNITNIENDEVVPFAVVSICQYQQNKIISYGVSDSLGRFELKVPKKVKVFDIKVSNVAFQKLNRTVAIDNKKNDLFLTLQLTPKTTTLDEISIVEYSPIIIKEDTTIYDISHFQETSDQTLEEVLSRIAGVKIDADGSIEVNGKQVQKVLINNEEVTDVGAAIITKSIDPSIVENVEVRFDEKDNKIKDSILDDNQLVVLDIKLKEDFDTSLFGKLRGTIGTSEEHTQIGGYTNLFSLKKKAKFHFFGEYDGFGHQSISLSQIKNIGKETLNKIFSTPANFEALSEKETFNEDIYGFNSFFQSNQQATFGLSSKIQLSKRSTLFIGTYNQAPKVKNAQYSQQTFLTNNEEQLFENNVTNDNFSTKNKIEYRYDADSIKVKTNANFVFNNLESQHSDITPENNYLTDFNNSDIQFYQNAIVEVLTKPGIGIQWKGNYAFVKENNDITLKHDDERYGIYLQDEDNNTLYDFTQNRLNRNQNFIQQLSFNYKSRFGNFTAGYLFLHNASEIKKEGKNKDNELINTSLFTANSSELKYLQHTPYIEYYFRQNWFNIDLKAGYNSITYTDQNFVNQQKNLFELKGRLDIDVFKLFNTSVSYKQFPSSYILSNVAKGLNLKNFNTVYAPPIHEYSPQLDQVIDINIYKNFAQYQFNVSMGTLIGKSFNGNINDLSFYPFITQVGGQLPTSYQIGYLTLEKRFSDVPLFFVLEPAFLFNETTNSTIESEFKNESKRYIVKFENSSAFKKIPYNYDLMCRYSQFHFQTESSNASDTQEMLQLRLKNNFYLFNRSVAFSPFVDYILFYNSSDASNLNLGGEVRYSKQNFSIFLEAYNLTNSTEFIMQQLDPSVYVVSQQSVFGRYLKVGLEVKLK
ncbi:hypothetical protein [Flammeovirga sp. EKP202]|uniref:hypothetical protein n=1 Tax=Flammeovirga sp. EKP202 TaxID=2770592 RepID=UPI00165FDBE2|nr:hypothetical protein [Flammeovirga sp. EKP202]MBD0404951.1 hypothetical protein [Flammeovirga sp. EKP202]